MRSSIFHPIYRGKGECVVLVFVLMLVVMVGMVNVETVVVVLVVLFFVKTKLLNNLLILNNFD